MPLPFRPPHANAVILAIFLSAFPAMGAEVENSDPKVSLRSAWQQATRFLFREAHEEFKSCPTASLEDERLRQLGLAVTLLGLQPRTQGNIQNAEASLRRLISENSSDSAGRFARFYLARLLETHAASPDPKTARDMYYELLLERPAHPMLELAAARIAYHDLYSAGEDPEKLSAAEANLRPLSELLETPAGRREFHSAVANSLNELNGDRTAALEHMQRAASIPSPLPQIQSMNILLVAELAYTLGKYDLAREYYTKFAKEFQRDSRNYSVRKILETLPEPSEHTRKHGTDS
jgi:hypothetical protein